LGERGRRERRTREPEHGPHHAIPSDEPRGGGGEEPRHARREALQRPRARDRTPDRERARGQRAGGVDPDRVPDREAHRPAADGGGADHPAARREALEGEARGGVDPGRCPRQHRQAHESNRRREGPNLLISLSEEENIPVMLLMYILCGRTVVMLATYSIAFVSYSTPEGKSELETATDMLNRATIQ